jgi:hypothetical protein
MRSHGWRVIAIVFSILTCGATFLFALYRQFALVEVAASMVVGVELYFLSSSIGDWIEKRMEPSRWRVWIAMGLAGCVVCYFLVARALNA